MFITLKKHRKIVENLRKELDEARAEASFHEKRFRASIHLNASLHSGIQYNIVEWADWIATKKEKTH